MGFKIGANAGQSISIEMSKIDATTLGDAAVGEARKALETVLGATDANGIKKELKTIKDGIGSGTIAAGGAAAIKTAARKIKTDIEAFEKKPEYQNLSDTVKKEFVALKSLADNLNTSSAEVADDTAAPEKFLTALEDFTKVYDSISDLNAAQTADLNEMRGRLESFVASPEGADTKLDSTNFTAFIDTLDTALSKISDQRAKLGEYM